MSLLKYAMEDFQMIDKVSVPDGYGGFKRQWVPGAKFQAAVEKQETTEALYWITTSRAINLQYHEVIKRLSDGKIFRVKSDGDDNLTPKSTTLDMRIVRAEEWVLTDE